MLPARIEIGGRAWNVDLSAPVDLTIPLDPRGAQPRAYGMPPASDEAFVAGSFIGDMRQGGPVNCFGLTLFPHGNGTHTEGAGHITISRGDVGSLLPGIVPAMVVTAEPVRIKDSDEHYNGPHEDRDLVVTRSALRLALTSAPAGFEHALIVRTQPFDVLETRDWTGQNPPYLTSAAMELVVQRGVRHLCIDLPSVDREEDGGHTVNHHHFWGVEGTGSGESITRPAATITEMIAVPDDLDDGPVLLSLQPAAVLTDAVPSRVVVWRVG